MIRSELYFVTIFTDSWFKGHDSSIAHEHIQSIGLGEEFSDCRLNRSKTCLITLDEAYFGFWRSDFDFGDQFGSFDRVSSSEEDVTGIFCGEKRNRSSSETSCA